MKKIFLSVATVIVTRFFMKVVDRVKNPPVITREELLHQEILRKKREYEQRRQDYELRRGAQPKVDVRFASTPRSPDAWMANIGTVGEMVAQYKENIPEPKEPCDGAALRPCADMGLRAWGGSCDGAAMGVAR